MKLTAKKAIELSIELWTWLAETGEGKTDWPEWEENGGEYSALSHCFLCEYNDSEGGDFPTDCQFCPCSIKYGFCRGNGKPYHGWDYSKTKTTHKKYAKQFLEQLKTLLEEAQ